jgi:predicted CxxxxCH...CXXCH cytochrome family protein
MNTHLEKMVAMMNGRTLQKQNAYKRNGLMSQQKQGKQNRISRGLAGLLFLGILLMMVPTAFAAEMLTNGIFNTNSNWTFSTATYDGANTNTADGSGSGTVSSSGRNTDTSGTIIQSVSIAAGSTIDSSAAVLASVKHTSAAVASANRSITVELRYLDMTTVEIFYDNTFADGTGWTSASNQTATGFPLNLAQDVDQVIVTLQTKDGNNASAASQVWGDDISITYSAGASPDTLSVTANTAVASSASPGSINLQMQYLQVDSDNVDDGQVVIESVTVDDLGDAAGADIDWIRIHIDNDNDFGNGVLETYSDAAWNAASNVFDITSLAAGTRTVSNGTSKYVWITYDLNSGVSAGTTIRSSVTAVGVSGPDNGDTGTWNSTLITVTTGPKSTITACSDCHDAPPTDSADATRNAPVEGEVRGDHQPHIAYTCDFCHINPVAFDHLDGDVNMKTGTIGEADTSDNGSYSKGATFAQSNSPTAGTCANVNCHGTTSPTWGVDTAAGAGCTLCHNNTTDDGDAANAYPTSTFRTADAVGLHAYHLTNAAVTAVIDGGVVCADCHTVPVAVTDAGHISTLADRANDAIVDGSTDGAFPAGSKARLNSYTPGYNNATQTCSVYCHDGTTDTDGTDSTPTWGSTYGTCSGSANGCHGLPPDPAGGTHNGYSFPGDCNGCHDTVNTGGTIAILSQHIDGTVQIAGCTGCHGGGSNEYPPLAATNGGSDGVGAHVAHIEQSASLMTKQDIGGATLVNDWCSECHTTSRGSGGHNDGYPAEVAFGNAVEAKYNGTAASISPDGGAVADGNAGDCTVYCHGANLPIGYDPPVTDPDWADTSTGCDFCHGNPPGGAHDSGADCSGCHFHVDGTDDGFTGGANIALHINGTVEATVSCTGCHTGSGGGGKNVGVDSPHSTNTISGSPTCESCHFADHASRTTGTFGILWDSRTMGTDYTADGKVYIVDGGTSTEAESCWACHEGQTPDVSEWDGSSAVYDYGSVTPNNLNWFTTSWSSANFDYKSGVLSSAMGSNASTHGTNGGADGVDQESEVSCTSCHDVHGINNNGVSTTSAPYLRGSWKASAYYEDGAPGEYNGGGGGSGSGTYIDNGEKYGLVPRASNVTTNGMGGYWIDQNSGSPANGTYATHAGLCTLCHGDGDAIPAEADDVTAIEGLWVGHKNSVAGGNDDGSAARNIFSTAIRIGDGVWNSNGGGAYMGNQNFVTERDVTKGWAGSIRNADYGDGVSPTVNGKALAFNNFVWGVSVDNNSVDDNFHSFSCSKCHNPHASRLPKLMITNCLDTSQNSWAGAFTGDAKWGNNNYSSQTYGTNELSKASTAQNCHRYISGQETSGWNSVTPW